MKYEYELKKQFNTHKQLYFNTYLQFTGVSFNFISRYNPNSYIMEGKVVSKAFEKAI